LPKIYDPKLVDQFELIEQKDAEAMARRLAAEEGICAGVSAAGRFGGSVARGRNGHVIPRSCSSCVIVVTV